MMAFSVHKSSVGKLLVCQRMLGEIAKLEDSIAKSKNEYEVHINEAQAIKADLAAVETKVFVINCGTILCESSCYLIVRWKLFYIRAVFD